MYYRNTSRVLKTFQGVSFKPGETKEVSQYINDPMFVRVESMPKEPPKRVNSNKKAEPKSTETVEAKEVTS